MRGVIPLDFEGAAADDGVSPDDVLEGGSLGARYF